VLLSFLLRRKRSRIKIKIRKRIRSKSKIKIRIPTLTPNPALNHLPNLNPHLTLSLLAFLLPDANEELVVSASFCTSPCSSDYIFTNVVGLGV